MVFLDQAADPPLGARPEHVSQLQGEQAFANGDTLVLYANGLIERRVEDITTGLDRLKASLSANHALAVDKFADALLRDPLPAAGATDDTALVVLRL